jgi:hypothetical protein
MPGGDGTGPMGQGPRTGGGRGICNLSNSAGNGTRSTDARKLNGAGQGLGRGGQGKRGQRGMQGIRDLNPSR